MSNTNQYDKHEIIETRVLSEENKDNNQKDILEKINKQIEFLKNKFEVSKNVISNEEEENKIDNKNNEKVKNILLEENNNEIIKVIKDEKYQFIFFYSKSKIFIIIFIQIISLAII